MVRLDSLSPQGNAKLLWCHGPSEFAFWRRLFPHGNQKQFGKYRRKSCLTQMTFKSLLYQFPTCCSKQNLNLTHVRVQISSILTSGKHSPGFYTLFVFLYAFVQRLQVEEKLTAFLDAWTKRYGEFAAIREKLLNQISVHTRPTPVAPVPECALFW